MTVNADWRARLADPSALAAADPGGMLARLAGFAALLRDARTLALPAGWEPGAATRPSPARLLVGGMGGSAIAGELLGGFYAAGGSARAHLQLVRDYRLPPLRRGDALVLCSYSGETEEVLALLDEARRAGLEPLLVTVGGSLAARAPGAVHFGLPAGHPPRAALPALLGRLLAIGAGLGLHDPADEDLDGLVAALDSRWTALAPARGVDDNPAKAMALALGERRPVFCAMAPAFEAVALRLRCQCEENAKRSASRRSLPELHHNSWVPWADGDLAGLPVWVGAADAHPRVLLRRRLTDALLAARGVTPLEIPATGGALLTRMLTTVLAGDTLSVYHALMRGVDPTPVTPLVAMKERLAASHDPATPPDQESA